MEIVGFNGEPTAPPAVATGHFMRDFHSWWTLALRSVLFTSLDCIHVSGAMVVAASLGSSILNLDREFPFLGEGNASGGVANIASRQIRSRLPVVEIALVLVVLIAAAVFSLKFRR